MTVNYHFGLIGWPLSHSLSPHLHSAALQAFGFTGDYQLFPLPPQPDLKGSLNSLFSRMRHGELHGLNVTIPHKQAVFTRVDELTPTAKAIGALNVIYRQDGRLIGDNTDVVGFLADLQSRFDLPKKGQVIVLGAGGAARAVVYALAQLGWQVYITARRLETATQLMASFSHISTPPKLMMSTPAEIARMMMSNKIHLVVNATSVGMLPEIDASPWPDEMPLPDGCMVYDLVYNPPETRFLAQARQQGLHAESGLGMLVNQAAMSFLTWTNMPSERLPEIVQVMETAAQSHLS